MARKTKSKPKKHSRARKAPKRDWAVKARDALLKRDPEVAAAPIADPPPPRPTLLRETVLQDAQDKTCGSREQAYGDPLDNFQAASALKNVFWNHFNTASRKHFPDGPEMRVAYAGGTTGVIAANPRDARFGRDSAHGHAIDLILTNLARIATQPGVEPSQDRFVDLAGYAALGFEVAKRT